MYNLMDAHFLTVIIIVIYIMVTPVYLLATYAFSNASLRKGAVLAGIMMVWGALML